MALTMPGSLPAQSEFMRKLLLQVYQGERDGMLVVIGWPEQADPIAFALGVEDEAQLHEVSDMARVLFARARVNHYVVAVPAWAESASGDALEVVVIQAFAQGGGQQCTCRVGREGGKIADLLSGEPVQQFTPWLGDLTRAPERVPGQQLRRIQEAYAQARIELPARL